MTDPVEVFVRRWNAIAAQPGLSEGERGEALRAAATGAAAQLGPQAERLVAALGFNNPGVAELVFDVLDGVNECPAQSAGQEGGGVLGLVPIILRHRSAAATLPRRGGVTTWAPPLADGRAVPGLVDFLLTWEEISNPATTWALHEVLRAGSGDDLAATLELRLGASAPRSMLDGYRKAGAELWSLRFAPYCLESATQQLFASRDAALAWARDAVERATAHEPAAGFLLRPSAPLPYRDALGYGVQQNLLAGLEDLKRLHAAELAAAAHGTGETLQLLAEPFGTPSAGFANFYRLSLLGDAGYASTLAAGAVIPWRRLWFRRDVVGQRIATLAREALGLETVIAPLIQDSGTLFMEAGPMRLLIVLGPIGPAEAPQPGELAITSPTNPTEEQARWWTLAEDAIEPQAEVVAEVLAAAAGVATSELQVDAAYVIRQNAWRPAFTVRRRGAAASDGPAPALGLADDALQAAASSIEQRLARRWVYCQSSGSQGFLTSPVVTG